MKRCSMNQLPRQVEGAVRVHACGRPGSWGVRQGTPRGAVGTARPLTPPSPVPTPWFCLLQLMQPHVILLPPDPTSALPDRQRLEVRLDRYGLVERIVKGDGNCQFRALSDQLYR